MKINKVGQATSSVVRLAQVQTTNRLLGKVSITKSQLRPEIQDTNGAIIKRAETIRSTINHLVYLSEPTSSRTYFDYLLPSDSVFVYFFKNRFVDDIFYALDQAPYFLVNKGLKDVTQYLDHIELTLSTLRAIYDAQTIDSYNVLRVNKAARETVTVTERKTFAASLSKRDSAVISELIKVLFLVYRRIEDTVTATDTKKFTVTQRKTDSVVADERAYKDVAKPRADTFFVTDAKSNQPGKGLFETVSTSNPQPKFSITRLFRDSTEILDLAGIFDGLLYQASTAKADYVAVSDVKTIAASYIRAMANQTVTMSDSRVVSHGFGRLFYETPTATDANKFRTTKALADAPNIDEALTRVFQAYRLYRDTVTVTESFDSTFYASRLAQEALSLSDVFLYILTKRLSFADTFNVDDSRFFAITKSLAETQAIAEQSFKTVGKPISDLSTVDTTQVLFIGKQFSDFTTMLDLTGVFDGITYQTGMHRIDSFSQTDVFTRIIDTKRVFEEASTILDPIKLLSSKSLADAITNSDDTTIVPGKNYFDTVLIGSGYDTRFLSLEKVNFGVTKSIVSSGRHIFDSRYDAILDPIADLTTGTTFTGSALFDASSVTSEVQIVGSGDGTGQTGGFIAPAIAYGLGGYLDQASSGNYIKFAGLGSRWLKTVALDLTTASVVSFQYIAGDSGNGGDRPESGENLLIEYSTNNGSSYTTGATVWSGLNIWPNGTSWGSYTFVLPAQAKTSSTILRWRETGSPNQTGDNYGLINFLVGNTSTVEIYRAPYFESEDTAALDNIIHAHTAIRRYTDIIDFTRAPWVTSSDTVVQGTTSTYNLVTVPSWAYFKPVYTNKNSSTGTFLSSINASTTSLVRFTTNSLGNVTHSWVTSLPITTNSSYPYLYFAANTTGSMVVAACEVSVTPIYSTNDGASWSIGSKDSGMTAAFTAPYRAMTYDKQRNTFIALWIDSVAGSKGSPNVYYMSVAFSSSAASQAGINWSQGTSLYNQSNSFPPSPQGMVWVGGTSSRVVMVRSDGNVYSQLSTTTPADFWSYEAGLSPWSTVTSNNVSLVAANSSTVITVDGAGRIYKSTNGGAWTSLATLSPAPASVVYDESVDKFIAIASADATQTVWTSVDAVTWTSTSIVANNVAGRYDSYAVKPGTTTAGTSTLLGLTFVSNTTDADVIKIYYGESHAYVNNPTPHGVGELSTTVFDVYKTAKAGTQYSVSGTTVTTADTDRLFVGQQWGTKRQSGDSQEKVVFDIVAPKADTFTAGKNFDDGTRYNSLSSETVKFTATKRANNEDGTNTHPVIVTTTNSFVAGLRASRGTTGTTTIKTIDGVGPTFPQSSVAIGRGVKSPDDVGTIDAFSRLTITNRTPSDSVTMDADDLPYSSATIQSGVLTTTLSSMTLSVTSTMTDASPNLLVGTIDDGIYQFTLPWNSAQVFNSSEAMTSATVGFSTNGYMSLDYASVQFTATNNIAAPIYSVHQADLQMLGAWYATTGTTPNRVFALRMDAIPYSGISTNFIRYEYRLYEANPLQVSIIVEANNLINQPTYPWLNPGVHSNGVRRLAFTADGGYLANTSFTITHTADSSYSTNYITRRFDWTKFSITKLIQDPLTVLDEYSLVTDGLEFIQSKLLRDTQTILDSKGLFFNLDAKASYSSTVSSVTTQAKDRDRLFVGAQYTGIYRAGDGLERQYLLPTLSKFDVVRPGRLVDDGGRMSLYNDTSETLKFNVTMKARADAGDPSTHPVTVGLPNTVRVSDSTQEKVAFDYRMIAYRGSSGNLILNTIDSSPDVTMQQSSVTIVRPARWVDEVGILDYFDLFWAVGKTQADLVTVGRLVDTGGRMSLYNGTSETLKFSITKLLQDAVIPDDLFSITDGLTFNDYKLVRDTTTVGLPNTVRVSGSQLENAAFFISMPATAGTTYTVSGVTKTARSPGDLVFVGQRYGGNKFGGDPYERITLGLSLLADNGMFGSNVSVVVTGSGIDQRQTTTENIKYTLTKLAKTDDTWTSTHAVTVGLPLGVRVSGSSQETVAFAYSMIAYRGSSGNLILNTIDSAPDVTLQQSSVTIVRPARWVDEVGALDYFDLFTAIGRRVEDYISVGRATDTGGRMSLYNGTSETVKFTITKLLQDTNTPDDFFSISDGLTYSATKLLRDTAITGVPGLGVRVSGDSREVAAFFVSMPAVAGTTYTVSGVTKTARSPGDLVFVGQRYGAGRFGGDPYEKMSMNLSMLAENGMFGSNVSVVVTGSGIDQRQTTTENIKYTLTKLAKTDDTYTSTHLVTVGLPFGIRVAGDTQENAAFAFSLKAKQGTNVTVSAVTTAAAANFETLFVGQRWGSIRQSQDRQELIAFSINKSLEAGSNTAVLVTTDTFKTSSNFIRGAAFTQEFPVILGEHDGHFSYALTQGVKYESLTAADSVTVSNLLFRTLTDQSGDLDQFGNINTMVSNGQLRMTDYVDISYLAEDFVGASRSFT